MLLYGKLLETFDPLLLLLLVLETLFLALLELALMLLLFWALLIILLTLLLFKLFEFDLFFKETIKAIIAIMLRTTIIIFKEESKIIHKRKSGASIVCIYDPSKELFN